MEGYRTYSGYKVGASHIAKEMCCEDFAATYNDERVCIAVISDGHGDKKCFRSARGAHIACDVSIECVKRLVGSPTACEEIKKSPDRIITEIEREIIREWNNGVNNDLITNPITDIELNGLPEDAVEAVRNGRSLNKIYGCTLIMCVVIDGFWFGIHIGDGKCVVAMNNGLYSQPIPWDEVGCVGNRSTSICNSNSFAGFRYIYGTDIPVGLFVASDGVDESFDENGLYRCYYTLGYWVQTLPKEELDSKMEELLTQVTNNGSGDDVSIACILSCTDDIKKPYASSRQVAVKIKELIDNIKEKETQFNSLTEHKKEVSEDLSELKSEIEELRKKIAIKENQIADNEQELINVDKQIHEVAAQLQKSVIQLPKAKETKERVDQYWKDNGVETIEDSELDYSPQYSEEYLGKVMIETEELQKSEQLEDESIEKTTSNAESDERENLKEEEEQNVNNEDLTERDSTEISESQYKSGSPVNYDEKIFAKENVQSEDKKVRTSDETDSKNPKNRFFGGLFGHKR